MKNKNNISLKILLSIIGLFILGVGVSFTIQSNLGTDPASTLELGVSKILNISYGACAAIYNIILLTIIFFIDKKYINISSILAIFIIGYTAEIFNFFLSDNNFMTQPPLHLIFYRYFNYLPFIPWYTEFKSVFFIFYYLIIDLL